MVTQISQRRLAQIENSMKIFLALTLIIGTLMASSLPKYETKTLENGLQIVVIPIQNGTGVISTDIFYKVGSRNEVMGKTGIAHMLEHMNFKSTKNLDAGEFDKEVKSIGGINNASTSLTTRTTTSSQAHKISTNHLNSMPNLCKISN